MAECIAIGCENETEKNLCSTCSDSDEIPEIEELPELDYSRENLPDEVVDVLPDEKEWKSLGHCTFDVVHNEKEVVWLVPREKFREKFGLEEGKGFRLNLRKLVGLSVLNDAEADTR